MSDAPDQIQTREQRLAREALASLPRPPADPVFRARLRREFAAGALTAARPEVVELRPPWWRSPLSWAAAAAVLIAAAGLWLDRGPDWSVVSATGTGVVVVNGHATPLDRRADLERALRRGGTIRLGEGARLELGAGGQMAIEVAPATDATVSAAAGRWLGRTWTAAVRSGELRFTTGRAFHGARLAIAPPEARVEVVGTTLAVIREAAGTCVCVAEGRVMMGPRGAPRAPIEAGRRRFIFNDGRAPEEAEMRPVEKVALSEMRARHLARME